MGRILWFFIRIMRKILVEIIRALLEEVFGHEDD